MKIKEIKIINQDESTEIADIGAEAVNVDYNDTTVKDELDKLNTSNSSLINTQTNQGTKLVNLQSQISGLASGSPLVASSTSEMTDISRVYVNTTDGHWYYYNGTEWTDGGVYQASEDSDTITKNTFKLSHLYKYDKEPILIDNKKLNINIQNPILENDNNYFLLAIPVTKKIMFWINSNNSFGEIFFLSDDLLNFSNRNRVVEYNNGAEKLYSSLSNDYFKKARTANKTYIVLIFNKDTNNIKELDYSYIEIDENIINNFSNFEETEQNIYNSNLLDFSKSYPVEPFGQNIRYNSNNISSNLIKVDNTKPFFTNINGTENVNDARIYCIDYKGDVINFLRPDFSQNFQNNSRNFLENTEYILITFDKTSTQLNYNLFLSYEPHYYDFSLNPLYSNNFNKINGVQTGLQVLPQNTTLYYRNKIFGFDGDSLSVNGSSGNFKNMAICQSLGVPNYFTTAVGGSSMEGTATNSLNNTSRINKISNLIDYLIVMCGTNGNGEIGELSLNNHDITTFIGAYNVYLSKIYYKFKSSNGYYNDIDYTGIERIESETPKDIKIIILTPPQNQTSFTSLNTKIIERTEALEKMSALWGIPVINLSKISQVNAFNWSTYGAKDGTHYGDRVNQEFANAIIGELRKLEPIEYTKKRSYVLNHKNKHIIAHENLYNDLINKITNSQIIIG